MSTACVHIFITDLHSK